MSKESSERGGKGFADGDGQPLSSSFVSSSYFETNEWESNSTNLLPIIYSDKGISCTSIGLHFGGVKVDVRDEGEELEKDLLVTCGYN